MEKITNNTNTYKTRDLNEASVLLTLKRPLIDIKREVNICWFVFEGKERCQQISQQYFFVTLLVNARDLVESQQILKNRIFS